MGSDRLQTVPRGGKTVSGSLDVVKKRLHIEINEEVTGTVVPELRRYFLDILDEVGRESWATIFIDLRPCRMIDSMGLNWLFAEIVRLRDADKDVVVRASSPAVKRVIEFSGLDKLVTFKFRRRKQTR